MNDEYQTQQFWLMKRSDLKKIIKEEIRSVLENEVHDKMMQTLKDKIGFKPKTGPSRNKIVPAEEKEYSVQYWYRYGRNADEQDPEIVKVMATTEEEAIKKAKEKAPRSAIESSFKIVD